MKAPALTALLRPGCLIEVGCIRHGRPSYRWAQGWEVLDPKTGSWSIPLRRRDALFIARQALAAQKAGV